MSKNTCAHCGRRLPVKRFGVGMSPLKARIVDLIMHGGEDGIAREALFQRVFRWRDSSRETMKTHVWQINQMLAREGYRIVCGKVLPTYRIVRIERKTRRAA